MITILGTSHIAKQSVDEITTAVNTLNPTIIAVELDKKRAFALLQGQNKTSIREAAKYGFSGLTFGVLGKFVQQKLGKMVGMEPGSEMKTALLLAKEHNLPVALIDQPIEITLKKLKFSWKERFRFLGDMIMGLIRPKKQAKELGFNFDLSKVPEKEVIKRMVKYVKKRYPNVYKTLIADRDKYMANKLINLQNSHPDAHILAVIGAGHQEGIEKILKATQK